MSQHQKHTKLEKPHLGEFARNELAILGTPCGNIKSLSKKLISQLSDFQVAYVDADHKTGDESPDMDLSISHGAIKEYTDKINYNQIDFTGEFNSYQRKKFFYNTDLVIVNGNHFLASKQLLVLDPKKSLEKKLDRITSVLAILKTDPDLVIPDYLKNHLGEGYTQIPILDITNEAEIASLISNTLKSETPSINGLLLGGGKSTRMKRDKGLLEYHGRPQREHAFDLLNSHTKETYLSCRQDQVGELPDGLNPLIDTFEGLGPFGGILSAFRMNTNIAWLSIAIDLPLLDAETLQYLIDHRNPSKLATSFLDPKEEFPEPLITIWEPRAYPEMLHFLSLGYSCPRKVLINSDIELLHCPDPEKLMNVNHPHEFDELTARI